MSSLRGNRLAWREQIHRRSVDGLPLGPANAKQLSEWPINAVAAGLVKAGRDGWFLRRLAMNLQQGMTFIGDYSGMECTKEAVELGLQGLRIRESRQDLPSPQWVRSLDKSKHCQAVLTQMARGHEPEATCVLGDILEKLSPAAQAYVFSSIPPRTWSIERRKQAFQDLQLWLRLNRIWAFPLSKQKNHCCVHPGQGCPSYPVQSSADGRLVRNGTRDLPVALRHLVVNTAGVTCVAHSAAGNNEGSAHISELPHMIWLMERRRVAELLLEDVFFLRVRSWVSFS